MRAAKMKRRRRHDRRKRIITLRREDALFFARGTFPGSARAGAVCVCGSRAFSRDPHDTLDDFEEQHRYCDEQED
jgi:hypothetical protein